LAASVCFRFRAGGFLELAAEEPKESAIDCCPARRPRPPAARRLPPRVTELPDAPACRPDARPPPAAGAGDLCEQRKGLCEETCRARPQHPSKIREQFG